MAAMSAKKKVPAVLKHYEVPKVLPAENLRPSSSIAPRKSLDLLGLLQIGGSIW